MHNILEIDSVTKRYGERPILSDIYLKCERGDIIGLFGRNGTGKSTLLKIVFGTEQANSKFIQVNGKRLSSQSDAFREISYLSQDSFLPHHITVSQVIKLTLNRRDINEFATDSIINPFLNNQVNSLSGGELRYLEIKLLLSLPSKFILLDEPFNGLSPILAEVIIEMIKQYSKSKGIILTDHDYHNVMDVANKYYLLNDGCLKAINDKEDLINWGYLNPEA